MEVADVHVNALEPKTDQRFIVTYGVPGLNSVKDYVQQKIPNHEWNFGRYIGGDDVVIRNDKLKELGVKCYPLKESVVSSLTQSVQ